MLVFAMATGSRHHARDIGLILCGDSQETPSNDLAHAYGGVLPRLWRYTVAPIFSGLGLPTGGPWALITVLMDWCSLEQWTGWKLAP